MKAIGGSDVCETCAAHCVAIEDLERDKAALEARCRDAAKLISDVVETPDQFETEWNKAAREWLASTSETFGEHGWTCASAKHLDMVTGNTGTMCRVCGEPHYSLETGEKS